MWFLEGLLRHRSFPFATDTCHGATVSAHSQSMTLLFDCPTPRHCAAQSRQQASGEASFSGRVHRPSFQRKLFRQSRQVSSAVTRSNKVTRRSSRGVTSQTVNSLGGLEQGQCSGSDQSNGFPVNISVPTTAMAKLGGSMGGVTLERSKLDLSQKVQTVEPKLSNDGGGGGIGKIIHNGGGGGGDDDDDPDEFAFGDDGGGDEGFWRSTVVQELYDEASLSAVLQEWYRTFADLPFFMRQSVQLGLFSSAQLVRFLCMDVRPGITRQVTRTLSPKAARGVVGRLMADPAFMQKLMIEELVTAVLSIVYESQQRGDQFLKELDLVALNTLSLMGATGAMVWLTAPSRSYGAVHKFPWQNMLHNLPNHVFDASTPYRRFSLASRVGSLAAKAGELCAVGSLLGLAQSLGGAGLVKLHQMRDPHFQPTLPLPEVQRASTGLAAYMGIVANTRYQLVSGADRFLFDRMKLLPIYLAMSSVLRAGSQVFANSSRVYAEGLPISAPNRQLKSAQTTVRKVKKVRRKVKKRSPGSEAQPEGSPAPQQGQQQVRPALA